MPTAVRRLASLACALTLIAASAACTKPSPLRAAMLEAGSIWNRVERLVEKDPAKAGAYAADVAKLIGGEAMTGSELYKGNEGFRELTTQTLEGLGRLQAALAAGSSPDAAGAMAEVRSACDQCHKQSWRGAAPAAPR